MKTKRYIKKKLYYDKKFEKNLVLLKKYKMIKYESKYKKRISKDFSYSQLYYFLRQI